MSSRISYHCVLTAFIGLTVGDPFKVAAQERPSRDQLAKCWQDLGAESAQQAYRAMAALSQDPDAAVKLLDERLTIASPPDMTKVDAWLKDLASGAFAARERAFQELRNLEEFAEA